MPKVNKSKPKTTKAAQTPEPAIVPEVQTPEPVVNAEPSLPIVYDKLEITEYSINSKQGALTPEDAHSLLNWETEKEYQKRMMDLNPGTKAEHWLFGDVFHCLDTEKVKVRCWNNGNNRPFDSSWCEDLIHTILQGQWAGPLTIPGETVNGETVRVGRHGKVLSGQHQLTALKLADEYLKKSRTEERNAMFPKYPFWNGHDHPVIETFVVTGLSEDERVLRTIDYVKPRTTADMLYTMELFRSNQPTERKDLTKMLAQAVYILWQRTDTKGYKTHPEIVGFLERHKRLLACVEHLFVENASKGPDGGRRITRLRLLPGICSAICYLMGCSSQKTTDYSDEYRNETPPSEKNLDWSYWDRAKEFWSCLATDRSFIPVRKALGLLVDSSIDNEENKGLGGRLGEKLAIISKAWDVFKDHNEDMGTPFNEMDLEPDGALCLSYSDLDEKGNKLPDGKINLIDIADFYGIDCPESVGSKKATNNSPPMPPPPSQEEIERATEEARRRHQQAKEKQSKKGSDRPGSLDQLAERARINSAADQKRKG